MQYRPRPRCFRALQVLSLAPFALASAHAVAAGLVLYYEERPPLMKREDDVLTGVEGVPAMLALQRAGISVELREAPVARQVSQVSKLVEPACALGLYRTPEREQLGKYSRQPIYTSPPQGLLVRTDGRVNAGVTSFASVMDDPSISLVLRHGYSYGATMDRVLAAAQAKVQRSIDNSAGRARMVLRGLADASLFTAEEAAALIEQFGPEGAQLTLRLFPDTPPGEGRYFFCSRSVPDATLDALDKALIGLRNGAATTAKPAPAASAAPR